MSDMRAARIVFEVLAGASLAAVLSGCKAAENPESVFLVGAGSTFAYPLYSNWAYQYNKLHPGVQINYQSIGSGGGIRQLSGGTVDFGATDGPMTDKQLASAKSFLGTDVLHFPVALGANVPTYNLPGISVPLNFTGKALADIFLGKITRWDDPELAKANPGVPLPASRILVCHRSDGSGTTYVWTDYLAKISPEWKSKVGVGTAVAWPVGLGGKGNEGVAGLIRQQPFSIGYVELIYAVQNKMAFGSVQNAGGRFIKADLNSVTAAASGASGNMPGDFRVSITNAPGDESYPISSFTWMLVRREMQDRYKETALENFLTWGLTDGQATASKLSYAPLSSTIVNKELQMIRSMR